MTYFRQIIGFVCLGGMFLLSKPAFAQVQDKPITQQKAIRWENLTFQNGVAFYKNSPFTGNAEGYYPLKPGSDVRKRPPFAKKGSFINGQLHGEYTVYNPNQTFISRETYTNGIKNGPFYYYYETGELEVKGFFKNDTLNGLIDGYYKSGKKYYVNLYQNGERHGKCTAYFENGNLETETEWNLGVPVGRHFGYFPDENLRYQKAFNQKGELHGENYVFHRTGCAANEEYYKNGKLDSVQRAWDALTCTIIKSGSWKDGKEHGVFVDYNAFGDTLSLMSFQEGKKHGKYAQFKEAREADTKRAYLQIETMGYYDSGFAHGYWIYGQVSNFQKREGTYDHGVKIGTWKYYDHKGELLLIQEYDNDGNLLKDEAQ
jgi:antitoxin component YwqK of YwqJK toxin-antitoxin module